MCRRREHPGPFPMRGPLAARLDATSYGHPHCGRGRGYGYNHHSCHGRQTLTGLAINAISTAIELKNQQRNEKAAAISQSISADHYQHRHQHQHQHEQDNGRSPAPTTGAASPDYDYDYAATSLDGMVRSLSLGEKAASSAADATPRAQPPPPPIAVGEAPPAYSTHAPPHPPSTSTSTVTASLSKLQDSHPLRPQPEHHQPFTSRLLQLHASHPTITSDLTALQAAAAQYHSPARCCGDYKKLKRARKALLRDLWVLEAMRLDEEGE